MDAAGRAALGQEIRGHQQKIAQLRAAEAQALLPERIALVEAAWERYNKARPVCNPCGLAFMGLVLGVIGFTILICLLVSGTPFPLFWVWWALIMGCFVGMAI